MPIFTDWEFADPYVVDVEATRYGHVGWGEFGRDFSESFGGPENSATAQQWAWDLARRGHPKYGTGFFYLFNATQPPYPTDGSADVADTTSVGEPGILRDSGPNTLDVSCYYPSFTVNEEGAHQAQVDSFTPDDPPGEPSGSSGIEWEPVPATVDAVNIRIVQNPDGEAGETVNTYLLPRRIDEAPFGIFMDTATGSIKFATAGAYPESLGGTLIASVGAGAAVTTTVDVTDEWTSVVQGSSDYSFGLASMTARQLLSTLDTSFVGAGDHIWSGGIQFVFVEVTARRRYRWVLEVGPRWPLRQNQRAPHGLLAAQGDDSRWPLRQSQRRW